MYTSSAKRPFGPYPCDEASVPAYTLPDPLERPDGGRVATAFEWANGQRARILDIFRKYEYGDLLPRPASLRFETLSNSDNALGGISIRKEVRIHASNGTGRDHSFDMLLYMPREALSRPVPAFLGLNVKGNHTTTCEEDVRPTGTDAPRGCSRDRWCFEETVRRGYASATICYHDIFRDVLGHAGESVFRLFFDPVDMESIQERYTPIGAWAWGLSCGLDCLEAEEGVRGDAVAVHGHSRLGKTALWTGAVDTRFAMVISNDSGCCGGALHRRKFGENLSQHFQSHVEIRVPPWFVNRLDGYIWREEDLPFDQHELMALIAPRPLAIGTANEDFDADPHGEFLAAVAASDVYRLFGPEGLPASTMPGPDEDVTGPISFHCRAGKHDQTPRDWSHYLDIADRFLRGNQ